MLTNGLDLQTNADNKVVSELNPNGAHDKPFSLSLQPLTAFAEVRYGRREIAKIEGRKTEKGKVGRDAEGEVGG